MKTIYKKLLFLFLLLPFSVLAQSTLSGVVSDSKSGQPLPGVNVTVQGASNGTTTDFDGKFQLGGLKSGDKIVFSFIGYDSQTVGFSGQKSVNISLVESANQLQEVVVQVGYGSVKKKDATGSVSVLAAKDFNKGSNVTTENLLNGRIAGVTVDTQGSPGSGSTIRIRGGSSLFASNDPLIVIDGLPLDNTTGTGATSFLASLNPSTVESISVLKDASATAIYGSRASNGVILITTKKGGKTLAVDYNFMYGSGKVINTVDVFSADQFRDIVAQHPELIPTSPTFNGLGTANTDWQNEIYRRTDYVDNNLSIRGNLFGAIPSRLTIGNTYMEGLRLTNSFNRNTVGVSLNPSIFKDHLKFKINANYSNERNRFANGVEGNAINYDPTQPVYDPASPYGGFHEYYNPDGSLIPQTPRNPVAELLQTSDKGLYDRIFGNIEMDYKFHFFPELRLVVNGGFDEGQGRRIKLVGADAASAGQNNNIPYGNDEYSTSIRRTKLFDSYLVYAKTFGKTVFDFTAGYSYQKSERGNYASNNILAPGYIPTVAQYKVPVVTVGFFGRTNFNYDDKYLLTLSYRRDGSSRFAKENRYGNFPAVGFAWKLNKDLLKENGRISDLKLRLGWGITGQQDIGEDNSLVYLQQYDTGTSTSQITFGTVPVPIAVSRAFNEIIKWEETTTYNAGIDFGIAKNRVSGTLDVYYKDSKDLLALTPVSDGGNFSNFVYQNIGSMVTKGIEFGLNVEAVKTNSFNWNVNFNTSHFDRKITELYNTSDIRTGDSVTGTGTQVQIHRVGYAPNSYFVYKQLYDAAGKPIEGAYADLNGDGIINADDKYIYKNNAPKVTFGFASNMTYKNLDFSFNMRASLGNRIFNGVNAGRAQYQRLNAGNALQNLPTNVLSTDFVTQSDSKLPLSDIWIENGSYLKMDNITVGYTFPKWLEGKASLRLFVGCQNVFTITEYTGLDPEVDKNGLDLTIYPKQRQLQVGANVKF
ncbi:SusC/RagA family TonB-linked outer membrane protein [Flavobacterium wongokense]|uniref:SusC/RagA family TonB-linked outer membrane protein n=1 Tax=Flavobacterium wongokense TaxID=2910674 RepID=UPI001F2C7280|nr:SusC/RagA family TonB-linked outer membrane protein [Flavobacterium sp. WG47]MCF6131079.1 SusC/RagA family TonB-linked outer membrane protein [Flavobacterium sp. WG47]